MEHARHLTAGTGRKTPLALRCRGENTLVGGGGSFKEALAPARSGGTKGHRPAWMLSVEKITAYLISAGILAFGIWIVANAEFRWGSVLSWLVVGVAPIAVGTASLVNEFDNERKAAKTNNPN